MINPNAARPAQTEVGTRTQATSFNDYLAERYRSQVQANVPRSSSAWGAEQQRLGSWGSGVGNIRPPGVGPAYSSGAGRPLFLYDPTDGSQR